MIGDHSTDDDRVSLDQSGDSHAHDDDAHFHSTYDPTFAIPEYPIPQSFVAAGGRWTDGGGYTETLGGSGGTITWSLGGVGLLNETGQADFYTGASVDMATFLPFDYVATLQRAFDAWSEYGDINFVQVADGGSDIGVGGDATIRVVGGYIDGESGSNVLAKAFYPFYTYFPGGGDIVFDNGNTSFFSNENNFFLTALHEIGHAIGLGHEDTSEVIAVMDPFINTSLTGLQPDDIAGIQAVYGAAGSPDLIAGNVAVSNASPTVNDTITVTYDITNNGNAAAVATTAGIYLSTDNVITADDTLLATEVSTGSTTAGAVDSESVSVVLPELAAGTYYIGVIADDTDSETDESDETNNASASPAAIDLQPDLFVNVQRLDQDPHVSLSGMRESTTIARGVDMAGAIVTAVYTDGTSETLTWQADDPFTFGSATGSEIDMSFGFEAHQLTTTKRLASFEIDLQPSSAVWDTTAADEDQNPFAASTPGTSFGFPFDFVSGSAPLAGNVGVTYSGIVNLAGQPAEGDLYTTMSVDFSGLENGGLLGYVEWNSDMDPLEVAGDLVPDQLVETDGSVGLKISASTGQYMLLDGSSEIGVTRNGEAIKSTTWPDWEILHAEDDGSGGYELLLKHDGGGYLGWQLDALGARQGFFGISNVQDEEPFYEADIDGDGLIGVPDQLVETDGSVDLKISASTGQYMLVDGSSEIGVTRNGEAIRSTTWSDWVILHAEDAGTGGYELLFRHSDGGYLGWQLDALGARQGFFGISNVQDEEPFYEADIDGDGLIGYVNSALEFV